MTGLIKEYEKLLMLLVPPARVWRKALVGECGKSMEESFSRGVWQEYGGKL